MKCASLVLALVFIIGCGPAKFDGNNIQISIEKMTQNLSQEEGDKFNKDCIMASGNKMMKLDGMTMEQIQKLANEIREKDRIKRLAEEAAKEAEEQKSILERQRLIFSEWFVVHRWRVREYDWLLPPEDPYSSKCWLPSDEQEWIKAGEEAKEQIAAEKADREKQE